MGVIEVGLNLEIKVLAKTSWTGYAFTINWKKLPFAFTITQTLKLWMSIIELYFCSLKNTHLCCTFCAIASFRICTLFARFMTLAAFLWLSWTVWNIISLWEAILAAYFLFTYLISVFVYITFLNAYFWICCYFNEVISLSTILNASTSLNL